MTEFVEIDEQGEIDVEAIMQQIRAYIVARKMAADDSLKSARHFDGPLAPDLYEALYHATMTYDQLKVPEMVTESSIPFFGRWLMAVRRQFHNLVRFYVKQVAARQIAFNKHLVTLAGEMVKELETLPTVAQVAELRREIERLRQESPGTARDQEDG